MIKTIKQTGRWPMMKLLMAMTLMCVGLSLLRCFLAGNKVFLFFNWNLFLAIIPWLATTLIAIYPKYQSNRLVLAALLLLWAVFFPNSPYILTDLFHLKIRLKIPIWFDLIEIVAFAWTGLVFGFVSLLDIEQLLLKYWNPKLTNSALTILLFISSYGVYMGRYLRWNSWDLIRSPFSIFVQIEDRITDPLSHLGTWGMTFFMGILLNMIFWSMKTLSTYKSQS
jgi:uncharacterized membrane protein